MKNIPIYRAKKIDSDEYAEGYLFRPSEQEKLRIIVIGYSNISYIIDTSTLAIHFDGMVDKNGTKIFAGLRVNNALDRKCGDLVKLGMHKGRVVQQRGEIFVNSDHSYAFYHNHKDGFISRFEWEELEVIGIQQ